MELLRLDKALRPLESDALTIAAVIVELPEESLPEVPRLEPKPISSDHITKTVLNRRSWIAGGAASALSLSLFALWSTSGSNPEEQLKSTLEEWRKSIMRGRPEEHARRFYADNVERFYMKRDLTPAQVATEWWTILKRYPDIVKLELRNVKFEAVGNDRASILLDKDWQMRGKGIFEGSVQQRLQLIRVRDRWRIIQEFEPKVYWVKRSEK